MLLSRIRFDLNYKVGSHSSFLYPPTFNLTPKNIFPLRRTDKHSSFQIYHTDLIATYLQSPLTRTYTMSTSSRTLKRKQSAADIGTSDSPFTPTRNNRQNNGKRIKSENVSLLKRYLIGCAHLIWVKSDPRERDSNETLMIPAEPPKKATAPTSDLPQIEMVMLYFNGIDRTVVSQSKSKSHLFAPPDFGMLEPYLFPWIRINSPQASSSSASLGFSVVLTRGHIKHVAFRIWEYMVTHGKVVVRYDVGEDQPENMPLGEIRGWWWETDGDFPRNYEKWFSQYDGNLPGPCLTFLLVLTRR